MIRIFALVIVTTVASLTGSASASSLAGHEGDVRRKPFFPMSDVTTGGCRSLWKEYVGASGHSAYASTLDAWPVEAVICGGVHQFQLEAVGREPGADAVQCRPQVLQNESDAEMPDRGLEMKGRPCAMPSGKSATTSGLRGHLARWLRRIGRDRYPPENHYMRGPGPATLRRQAREPQTPEG